MKQNVSMDVGTQGQRVKESIIIFQAHGEQVLNDQAATKVGPQANLKLNNQLAVVGGTQVKAASKYRTGGGKSLSFLPKIKKLYMDVSGAKFPSDDSLSDIGTDLQKAYALYCHNFKHVDEHILPFEDYIY